MITYLLDKGKKREELHKTKNFTIHSVPHHDYGIEPPLIDKPL